MKGAVSRVLRTEDSKTWEQTALPTENIFKLQ